MPPPITNVPQLIHVNNVGNVDVPGGDLASNTGAAAALNGIQFGPGGILANYTLGNCTYYATTTFAPYHLHHHHHHQHLLLWRHGQPVDLRVADRPAVLPAATGHRLLLWQLQDHAGYPGVLDVELWL